MYQIQTFTKSPVVVSLLFLLFTSACAQNTKVQSALSKVGVSSSNDSFYYALGYKLEQDMANFCSTNNLDFNKNVDIFLKGIVDAVKSKNTIFDGESSKNFITKTVKNIREKMSSTALEEGKDFFEKNKSKDGVKELPNGQGIQYVVLKKGTGTVSPTLQDEVECHYVGTLLDGTEFDNSIKRGQPAKFPLGGVIKGWQLALAQMKEGDKWKIFIPSDLAYGPNGAGSTIPPNSTLIFEVELIKIHPKK